jgi:membrane associated rhomboid family serine protease
MTTTPVGMRCPECAQQRTKVRYAAGMPGRGDAPATYTLIALCVAAFIGEIATGGTINTGGGTLSTDGGLFSWALTRSGEIGVAAGEPYRLVTTAFLHAGILHLGFNMFALYFLGVLLEPAIGTGRFLGLYAVSVLCGSFGALLLDPNALTVGASGGIFGLMSGAFLIARHRGLDQLASQIGFFVILNIVFTLSSSHISLGAHLGGLVGGAVAGLLITRLERQRIANRSVIEAAVLIGICVIAIIGALAVADSNVPPQFA